MNKDIYGIIALIIFASPFLALIIIIAFKVYRIFRPSQAKKKSKSPRKERLKSNPCRPSQ